MVKETTTVSILCFYFTVICTVVYRLFVYQLLPSTLLVVQALRLWFSRK